MGQLSWSFGPAIVYLFLMGGANYGQVFGVGWLVAEVEFCLFKFCWVFLLIYFLFFHGYNDSNFN